MQVEILNITRKLIQPLRGKWWSKMQILETDQGTFIDNLPGQSFTTAWKGQNYKLGTYQFEKIVDSQGHKWLQPKDNQCQLTL